MRPLSEIPDGLALGVGTLVLALGALGLLFLVRRLWAKYPNDSVSLPTTRPTLVDPDSMVRFEAAWAVGNREALHALALDPHLPRSQRKKALLHLAECHDPRARALALDLLAEGRFGPAPWEALSRLGDPLRLEELPPLAGLEAPVLVAAASCLALVGPPAEPALLALLADRNSEVATAAADALGFVGTLRALSPLRARQPNPVLTNEPLLTQALRDARARIEVRSQQQGGTLSLAEAEGGTLGLVESKVGGLSDPRVD